MEYVICLLASNVVLVIFLVPNMAGKCCKSENSSSGCPVMASEPGCCKKKNSAGCCISEALGVPRCVVMTAAAVVLVGVSAAVTMNYLKRK